MDMKEIVVEELSSLESLGASVISLDGRMLPESRQFLLSLLDVRSGLLFLRSVPLDRPLLSELRSFLFP